MTAIRFIDRKEHVLPQTKTLYRLAIIVALVGNALLLALKAVGAFVTASSAIYADAANSAADVGYSLLMALGLWLSLRPADETHPHGHRRIEPLVGLFIGTMMALAGVEAVRTGISAWRQGGRRILSAWGLVVPAITCVLKATMYPLVRSIGRRASSPAIIASAKDNLSDTLTSAVALVGVAASRFGVAWADPLAALLVAVWIFRASWDVLHENVQQLVGGSVPASFRESIIEAVRSVPEVCEIDQLIVEYAGPQVRADIHVTADRTLSLDQVHRLSHRVRAAVESLEQVDHAFVHVEPCVDCSLHATEVKSFE